MYFIGFNILYYIYCNILKFYINIYPKTEI
jgi:hypothetical protein